MALFILIIIIKLVIIGRKRWWIYLINAISIRGVGVKGGGRKGGYSFI